MRLATILFTAATLTACMAEDQLDPMDPAAWGGEALDEATELDAALPADAVPPPNLRLAVSGIEAGQTARATVGNLPRGLTVHWAASFNGPGNGPCPPALNGSCVGLSNPTYLGSTRSVAGYATTQIAVPAIPNGVTFYVQALVVDPNGRPALPSPVESRASGPVACPMIFAPVCGVNGVTYDNACIAGAEGWLVDHQGPC
jgi:hypothetical protein